MKAIMLAAGVGRRLYGDEGDQPSKALLPFGGKTLLRRHIEVLRPNGVEELTIVVGYRKEEVVAEALSVAGADFVDAVENPDFRGGPIVSLWCAREVLRSGAAILFMDADVLYHPMLLERLIGSRHENCFLLDRDIEPGEDPVRLCIRDASPVDFGKVVEGDFDMIGEWPGFLRLSPRVAARVADATETYIERGEIGVTYEEAVRDVLVDEPPGTFGYEDITGIPWIEIDFPSDLLRAEKQILPRILARPAPARGQGFA
ncbi:MAG: phosphocholine cytidylyltransferase family protein [Rhodospirillales bacterium]|jgi:choline kinase|nr:phosphocholine cytidylyltransferase family protein [Rhodospirillales bacterium]MDP6883278.1 phosphocholine cytidylyltransferase family protein [Rhodospirillales bacterium]